MDCFIILQFSKKSTHISILSQAKNHPMREHESLFPLGYSHWMTCFVPFIPLGSLIPFTPWKTNMSPENHWLEDAFPVEIAPFYGTCSFSGVYSPGGKSFISLQPSHGFLLPAFQAN